MSSISETYNRVHNILELVDIYQMFLSTSWNVTIADKNCKCELTDELPNKVRLNA